MPDQVPEPTELIYAPADSWAPAIIALGVAVAAIALFGALFWAFIGGLIALGGLRAWWKQSDDEIAGMRREQSTDTAVIPAEPIRRS